MFGRVYTLDLFAPYAHIVDGQAVTGLHRFDSIGGVYLSDLPGLGDTDDEVRDVAASIGEPPASIVAPVTVETRGKLAA